MAKFCTKCGKPLDECTCEKSAVGNASFFASLKTEWESVNPRRTTRLYMKRICR